MDEQDTIDRLQALAASSGPAPSLPSDLARSVLRRRRRRDAVRRVSYGAVALVVIAGGSAVWSNSASATPQVAARTVAEAPHSAGTWDAQLVGYRVSGAGE